MSAEVFSVLKIAGSLYLLYLAWKMWRDAVTLEIDQKTTEASAIQIAIKGIVINLLNPKLTIFFFAFLPLFVAKNSVSPTFEMISLSVVFMAMTFMVFVLYGILASGISRYFINSSEVIRRFQQAFAGIFAVLAVKLALSEK